jgi:hypothetical protein
LYTLERDERIPWPVSFGNVTSLTSLERWLGAPCRTGRLANRHAYGDDPKPTSAKLGLRFPDDITEAMADNGADRCKTADACETGQRRE